MIEQPDFLGGKATPGHKTPRVRRYSAPKVAPAGHAAKPGTGPAGETCGGCHWLSVFHFRRTYNKCGARPGDTWKGGRATDIRPLDAACSKFQRAANRLPPAGPLPPETADDKIAATIAALGTGHHTIRTSGGVFDIYMGPAVIRPQQEQPDERQASLFD